MKFLLFRDGRTDFARRNVVASGSKQGNGSRVIGPWLRVDDEFIAGSGIQSLDILEFDVESEKLAVLWL